MLNPWLYCARKSALRRLVRARVSPLPDAAEEQITKKMIRVNKAVRSRRTWAKFGDCEGQEVPNLRACTRCFRTGSPTDALGAAPDTMKTQP